MSDKLRIQNIPTNTEPKYEKRREYQDREYEPQYIHTRYKHNLSPLLN